jgi:hypothetical protein
LPPSPIFLNTPHKDASKAKDLLEATLVWICAQFSTLPQIETEEKKQHTGDGRSERSEDQTVFWAVATPL